LYRYNEENVTKISYFIFDIIENKEVNVERKNIMIHTIGVDFNASYTSSYSSVYNEMGDYGLHY
jgi:hypothetical protein